MRFSLGLVLAVRLFAQAQTPPDGPVETTTKDEPATFKARVNLVMVPVVVRDKQGRGDRDAEERRISSSSTRARRRSSTGSRWRSRRPSWRARRKRRRRKELRKTRRNCRSGMSLTCLTISTCASRIWRACETRLGSTCAIRCGRTIARRSTARPARPQAEFTDDKDKLRGTLFTLQPRSISNRSDAGMSGCQLLHGRPDPEQERHDGAERGDSRCDRLRRAGPEGPIDTAVGREHGAGRHVTGAGRGRAGDAGGAGGVARCRAADGVDSRAADDRAGIAGIPRDGRAPGRDGHHGPGDPGECDDQQPGRARLVGRSGYRREPRCRRAASQTQYDRDDSAVAESDVLAELASGTGGTFFQNNNDLAAGFRKLAELPEYVYVLGFSPQNLKLDGSYHSLKVILRTPAGLDGERAARILRAAASQRSGGDGERGDPGGALLARGDARDSGRAAEPVFQAEQRDGARDACWRRSI